MIPIEPLEFIYNELDKNGDQTVCASELSEYITHSTPLNAKQQISFKVCRVCARLQSPTRAALSISNA